MDLAVIVVGLGYGDEGKGATVDYLCSHLDIQLVVRFSGGPQSGHNVVLRSNQHCFSSIGAGYFAGALTYLSRYFAVDLDRLQREAVALAPPSGQVALSTVTISPDCLVITPYHIWSNPAIDKKDRLHMSCGSGHGEAVQYYRKYGQDALFINDLSHYSHRDLAIKKLELMRHRLLFDRLQSQLQYRDMAAGTTSAAEMYTASPEVVFEKLTHDLRYVQVGEMPRRSRVLFEGSQGVLLDQWIGTTPQATWTDTTSRQAETLISEYSARHGNKPAVEKVGVIRAVPTRHGDGPFNTENPALATLLSDPNNPPNDWQGVLRYGHFDDVLFRYAVQAIPGLGTLAVTHLDDLKKLPTDLRKHCTRYCFNWFDNEHFTPAKVLSQPAHFLGHRVHTMYGAKPAPQCVFSPDTGTAEGDSERMFAERLAELSGVKAMIFSDGPDRGSRITNQAFHTHWQKHLH